MIKHRILTIASLCYLGAASLPHFARADDAKIELRNTNHKLVSELVKLAKFNTLYQMEANRHQQWRSVTYPLGREAGTALSLAATLVDLNQQAIGLDNPRRINRNTLKNAVRCGITGSAVSGAASASELAQNTWMMFKARQQGFSPKRSLAFVKEVIVNTDRLITRRTEIAEQFPPELREVVTAETQLVLRIRQQLLAEFGIWSCHSRSQAWRENTFYAIDAAQNFTRMGAGILALKAFDKPRLAKPSVVCAMISASAATVNPIVRNLVGFAVRKHQERKLAKEFSIERPGELAMEAPPSADDATLNTLVSLTERSARIDSELDRESRLIERYRQVAQQQSISGPLIGLTGVASATLATVAVYGHNRHPHTALQLGFSGRISQAVGQSYALVATPYSTIRGALRKRSLSKRGMLPRQILQERLQRLQELSKSE